MADNVFWHAGQVTRDDREKRNTHSSFVMWFTGLSGAGKSTIAHAVEAELFACGHQVMVLDGDNVRHGLCSDLGFSEEDRHENLRRIGEVAKLFVEAGVIVLAAEHHLELGLAGPPLEILQHRHEILLHRVALAAEIHERRGILQIREEPAQAALGMWV